MNIFGFKIGNSTRDLTEKIERLRDMKAELQPLLDEVKALENEVKSRVLGGDEFDEVEGVSITVRDGYTRVTWDSKALDGYATANPEIEKFRKSTDVGPSVAIKVKK